MDFVAYVAKDATFGRACHVLECDGGLAQDVITTIGQAFEIRFKQHLAKRPTAVTVPDRLRFSSAKQCILIPYKAFRCTQSLNIHYEGLRLVQTMETLGEQIQTITTTGLEFFRLITYPSTTQPRPTSPSSEQPSNNNKRPFRRKECMTTRMGSCMTTVVTTHH